MLFDLSGRIFRNIFFLESRAWWEKCQGQFDASVDLVLTYDFGLQKDIERLGGTALLIDHLVDPETMQKNNFLIYEFFSQWNMAEDGNDLFSFRGVSFGFSFRLDIWNDFTFYLRTRICVEELLRTLVFDTVFAGTQKGMVESILDELSVPYQIVAPNGQKLLGYYFPIFRYMHENTRSFSWKSRLKDWFMLFQGSLMPWLDRLSRKVSDKPAVFIQEYHPTRKILEYLRDKGNVRVVVERISATMGIGRYLKERPIPMWGKSKHFRVTVDDLLQNFRAKRHSRLVLAHGSDVSDSVYKLIEGKLESELPNQIRLLNNIINYVDSNPIALEILIGNVGRVPTLLDCVLKNRNMPSYLIINGLLGPAYLDESKYATVINGYSESIKNYYFKEMDNIVCLGDPRMDAYTPLAGKKSRGCGPITITIGASGFNPVDLNSYVAVEFAFLHDVLQALCIARGRDLDFHVVIKVRPNGYRAQYESFVAEYFPQIDVDIIDNLPMRKVLEKTDFYISIYSQTLFEASCLGIPVVYYRKDNEIMNPPFDGKSELVTVDRVDTLVDAVLDFHSGHERFDAFLQRSVMEKYIGPLDGENLERNLDYINGMLTHIDGMNSPGRKNE